MTDPSIEGKRHVLATHLLRQRRADRDRILPTSRQQRLTLSHQQESLWFLDRMAPGLPTYNVSTGLRLRGELDVRSLWAAVAGIVARHESARTRFGSTDGVPYQIIDPPGGGELPVSDLRSVPPGEREARMRQLADAEAQRPFDLAVGPLLRCRLVRLYERENVLLLGMHHIVTDGWSLDLLTGELAELYAAALRQQPDPLVPLPLQPADVAAWQRRRAPQLDEQLAYWREALDDLPALDFPRDHPRPRQSSWAGSAVTHEVPAELGRALAALASRLNISIFSTLLAGFLATLAHYTGQNDLVVGSVLSGRTRAELEPLVGYLANTVVLRTDVGGDPEFRELASRCQCTVLNALAHQDAPFSTVVDAIRPERDPSANPLFQVSFSLQRGGTPNRRLQLGGLAIELVELTTTSSRFDLGVNVHELAAGGLRMLFEYSIELFERDRIRRLAGHLHRVWEQVAADPGIRISQLRLLTVSEHAELVRLGSRHGRFPSGGGVHSLFEQYADRTPAAVAVVCGEDRVTYRELEERANRLAHRLRSHGVRRGSLVGLCCTRSVSLVVGVLGILKAGGAYVPLDPDHSADRLRFILDDSGVASVVAEPGVHLPPGGHRMIPTDDGLAGNVPNHRPAAGVVGEDPAYLIYTSGSTGRPKAVVVPHRAVSRLLTSTPEWFRCRQDDVWTLFHSLTFDFSVWELWGALAHGGKLVVVPYWTTRSPRDFHALLARERVTVLNQTPAAFRQLVEVGQTNDTELALRAVMFGGEALDVDSVRQWLVRHGSTAVRLVNMYGITETTVNSTWCELDQRILAEQPTTIGAPLPDLSVWIVDRYGHLTPVGVPGEIWIGGPGVATGYHRRPGLTANRFVPDPFSGKPGVRLYRSGDLARWSAKGNLEFLGRMDRQVKVRGFRIELGEIEAALIDHPQVRAAVVSMRQVDGQQRILAHVVPEAVDVTAVRTHLRDRLPEYAIPSAIMSMTEFPLSRNGKIDQAALPTPATISEISFVQPESGIQTTLAEVWSEVLGLSKIGVRDDFFTAGGNSLDLVRLQSRIAARFGVTLELPRLYLASTIELMALEIAGKPGRGIESAPDEASLIRLTSAGRRPPLFLVHPIGGSALPYITLASALSTDQPVFAFEAPGLRGRPQPGRVEELAAGYVSELREAQPTGPYSLGGWSFGGTVAFEMAHQLHAQGEKVASLLLVDSQAPRGPHRAPPRHELLTWFVRDVCGQRGVRLPALDLDALTRAHEVDQHDLVLVALTEAGLGTADLRDELVARIEVFIANWRALSDYRPRRFPGWITVFRAIEQGDDHVQGWERLSAAGVSIHPVGGNHYTMLRPPHLARLAGLFGHCLTR